jgi:aspartyl-tRNA synthetase
MRSAAARSVSSPRDFKNGVFAVMGLPQEEAQGEVWLLLDAFNYGPPPHGGIAFGWDRICALLVRIQTPFAR